MLHTATRFLRLKEVLDIVGVKKTKLYAMMKDGDFPEVVKLGHASVWPEDRVIEWQRKKIAA